MVLRSCLPESLDFSDNELSFETFSSSLLSSPGSDSSLSSDPTTEKKAQISGRDQNGPLLVPEDGNLKSTSG